jgi:hypothetical protein
MTDSKQTLKFISPIIWAFLWQGFGEAISLPFYYCNHLKWLNSRPQVPNVAAESSSQGLPISFLLGAVFPMIVGMLPTWADRSSALHHNVLAAWQLDPVWVTAIQARVVLDKSYRDKSWQTPNKFSVSFCFIII